MTIPRAIYIAIVLRPVFSYIAPMLVYNNLLWNEVWNDATFLFQL